MKEAIDAALAALAANRPAALVTPVDTQGSLPTPRQARMLVLAEGTSIGTVGGGKMEAEARQAALAAIGQGLPRLIHFSLTAKDALAEGSLCGGQVTFYVEPLESGRDVQALAEIQRLLEQRLPGVEAVRLSEEAPVRRLVAAANGPSVGSLGAEALDRAVLARVAEVLAEDRAGIEEFEEEGAPVQIFLQALQPRPTVFLCGGGHVGLALARLVPTLGLQLAVIDDRPEFCNRERFPMADELYVRDFSSALADLPIDELSYIVAMTRGHRWDQEVVAQALRTRAGYIGMIGSRRKVALTWKVLRQKGFTEADLARVHAPIGLDLGGDTPGEIAISVAAELIQVRRQKSRQDAMLYLVETDRDLETTCRELQEAVARHKFGVLHVHNLKETLAQKGVAFGHPCRLFEVCNPHQAKRVLEQNLAISTALPCRIAVYEEGGRVKLATIRPQMMIERFGEPELASVAEEVEQTLAAIMDEAAGKGLAEE